MRGNPAIGARYLWRGFQLLQRPGLRRYVALPLLFNFTVFGLLLGLGAAEFDQGIELLLAQLPGWLNFLRWILWPLALLLLLIAGAYISSIVANLIAAPFNGLLAERAEALLTGAVPADTTLLGALADAPRAIGKELRKLLYYLPRALLVLVLSLIPLFYPVAPLLWFLFGAWMMALQYCDYPLDNHRHSLRDVRVFLAGERLTSLGFGAAVTLGAMVPLVNLLIMPAAVCGATIYWVEKNQPKACAIDR